MEYHSISVRNRAQYATQRIDALESIEKTHWRLEENKDENDHTACMTLLSTSVAYIETSVREAKYHAGFHKAVLCVEIFKHMLFNLDRDALSPLFVYCDQMEHFVETLLKSDPRTREEEDDNLLSPSRRPQRPRRAIAPLAPPLPRAPKRFIELPKQERHVLQVALYLKQVLTKLSGEKKSKLHLAGSKFKRASSFTTTLNTAATELLPRHVTKALRGIKTKLRKHLFFVELPKLVGASGDAGGAFLAYVICKANNATNGGDSHQAKTHQAFSSFFVCLHEIVRSTGYHSAELAEGAFDLLGEVLRAIEAYIVEVVGHRKKRRTRIKFLRLLRQDLRTQFSVMEAETNAIAQDAIKLSNTLTAIEFEYNVLHQECAWHVVSKDLMLHTIAALQRVCDLPPLWFVDADGVTKTLQLGTAVLRPHNVQHIRYMAQLLALSRSYVHVALNNQQVLEANPGRKMTLMKLNHQGRMDTLKMHLMNQRPVDAGAPPSTPSTAAAVVAVSDAATASLAKESATSTLHKVTDAELAALAAINEGLRAVEAFMRDDTRRKCTTHRSIGVQTTIDDAASSSSAAATASVGLATSALARSDLSDAAPSLLSHHVQRLPTPWNMAFPLLHAEEVTTPMPKDDLHRIISAIYLHYEDVVTRAEEAALRGSIPFVDFVVAYFMVHHGDMGTTTPIQQQQMIFESIDPTTNKRNQHNRRGSLSHESQWASFDCARFLVSIHLHVTGAVGIDWLGYFAVFVGLAPGLALPASRALDAFLLARRMLLAAMVVRQRQVDPSAGVVWVMARDVSQSSVYTLQTAALKVLAGFSRAREFYTTLLTDKSTTVDLFVEDDDGSRDIKASLVLHIETALLVLMQAWVREHHHTLATLDRSFVRHVLSQNVPGIFRATLTYDVDGSGHATISFNEFVATMGYLDVVFTPARLASVYMAAAAHHDSANALGEASVAHVVDTLYRSDLFLESKRTWLTVSAMHVANQRSWDDGTEGLVAMWKHHRDRILDRLSELKTTQVNLAIVQTCCDRHVHFESLLAAATAASDDIPAAVDVAWYAFHFLQQDIAATMHAVMKQQKPKARR
ncbi:Aste57867_8781 [Aphanomyces stellatus]|uniref:Aste57867_8781 protein n=1 Tax=Aphanomyces stellatus TaxID=120398 RepID=A0A485KL46_9STRA|nr:hypothetical protein As57867_008747 [Aphanomyces stellatus]VFT85667.1 Aste57867_8781 [Aphanomyces stellatus]